jgi:hypothetical protein
VPNFIHSGWVLALRNVRLGSVFLACVAGAVFAAGMAPAARSATKPARCEVTPCLLIGPAGGHTYVFTAWESNKYSKLKSIDLTLFSSAAPTAVRSTGKCAAPAGPGHYSKRLNYYNLTCTLTPAGRALEVCFTDRTGLENHTSTAEFLQAGIIQAYAVQKTPAVAGCPVKR